MLPVELLLDSEGVVAVSTIVFVFPSETFLAALLYLERDHGGHALAVRAAAAADGEEGFHP
jgi:membrane protein YqaA with SNARE-associated domain